MGVLRGSIQCLIFENFYMDDGYVAGHLGAVNGLKTSSIHV